MSTPLTLPKRSGPLPETQGHLPHSQLTQHGPDEIIDALHAWCFALPNVNKEDSGISVPGSRALVLQDGIGDFSIPWNEISAVFVGGSDNFKISPECIRACKTANIMGKWVHVGRVNGPERLKNWLGLADSIDGSGISKYDHMLATVVDVLKNEEKQQKLL